MLVTVVPWKFTRVIDAATHSQFGSEALTARSSKAHWPGCKPAEAGPLVPENPTEAPPAGAPGTTAAEFIVPIRQIIGQDPVLLYHLQFGWADRPCCLAPPT
jgi:hypothetical protein